MASSWGHTYTFHNRVSNSQVSPHPSNRPWARTEPSQVDPGRFPEGIIEELSGQGQGKSCGGTPEGGFTTEPQRSQRRTKGGKARTIAFRVFLLCALLPSFACATKSSHLVFLASIVNEETASSENGEDSISRSDAGTRGGEGTNARGKKTLWRPALRAAAFLPSFVPPSASLRLCVNPS